MPDVVNVGVQFVDKYTRLAPERKLCRICVCKGWAIHGLVFEYDDGTRVGNLLSNDATELPTWDEHIIRREGRWFDVSPGDYIVRIWGNCTTSKYLCHAIAFQMESGTVISMSSSHESWKGREFSFSPPSHLFLLRSISFSIHRFRGLRPFVTCQRTSIHLPVEKATSKYLPDECKQKLHFLLKDLLHIHDNKEQRVPMSMDLCWVVLSNLSGYDLLEG